VKTDFILPKQSTGFELTNLFQEGKSFSEKCKELHNKDNINQ